MMKVGGYGRVGGSKTDSVVCREQVVDDTYCSLRFVFLSKRDVEWLFGCHDELYIRKEPQGRQFSSKGKKERRNGPAEQGTINVAESCVPAFGQQLSFSSVECQEWARAMCGSKIFIQSQLVVPSLHPYFLCPMSAWSLSDSISPAEKTWREKQEPTRST